MVLRFQMAGGGADEKYGDVEGFVGSFYRFPNGVHVAWWEAQGPLRYRMRLTVYPHLMISMWICIAKYCNLVSALAFSPRHTTTGRS